MNRALSLFLLSLVVGGCANLEEVRQFAGESAKLASYKELTVNFRDTYAREAPYLSGSNLDLALVNDRKRQEAYKDLVAIHETVTLYMMTLAKLAGDKTFDLTSSINSVTGQIKVHPELGVEDKHVDAVSNIVKLATKWALALYQQDAVKDMIRAGQPSVQVSLDGMQSLLRIYRKTLDNERKQVLGLFETEFALSQLQTKDPLLMALAKVHYQEKQIEYDAMDRKLSAAGKAIEVVATGHTQLYKGTDNLSAKELKVELSALTKDIKGLHQQLQALQ